MSKPDPIFRFSVLAAIRAIIDMNRDALKMLERLLGPGAAEPSRPDTEIGPELTPEAPGAGAGEEVATSPALVAADPAPTPAPDDKAIGGRGLPGLPVQRQPVQMKPSQSNPFSTKQAWILDIWSTTDKTSADIQKIVGGRLSDVSGTLTAARKRRDPRYIKGRNLRDKKADAPMTAPVDEPVPEPVSAPPVEVDTAPVDVEPAPVVVAEPVATVDAEPAAPVEAVATAAPRSRDNLPASMENPFPTIRAWILSIWSETTKAPSEIQQIVGGRLGNITSTLADARKRREALYLKGLDLRGRGAEITDRPKIAEPVVPAPAMIASPKPAVSDDDDVVDLPTLELRRPASKIGFAKPVERVPFTPEMPKTEAAFLPQTSIDGRPGVLGLDTFRNIVRGPLGDIIVKPAWMKVFDRMNDGGLYDHRTLAGIGGGNLDEFVNSAVQMKPRLAAIGIEFLDMPKVGCRIRIAGT